MLAGYSVSYDTVGRISNLGSWRDAFSTTYTYNATNQLTAATSTAIVGMTLPNPLPTAESYNLDANGNRRTAAGVSQSAAGTHNRLQSDGTYSYIYDPEGNVTRRTKISGGQVTDYAWDHRNRLVSVTEKVSATGAITKKTEYIYDAFDQRVGKRLDIGTIGTWDRYEAFIWADGQEVMRLVDSDGQVATQPYRIANRYLWGATVDQLLADEQYSLGSGPAVNSATASTTAGNTLWALTDHLGSVRDVVDNNGVIRQHVVYDSFGRWLREVDYNSAGAVIASTDPAAVDELFGYTGRDWDVDTQLQNNRARWYEPTAGRWLSQDPIGFAAGDANLYRYVGNHATGATDSSGRFRTTVHMDITLEVLLKLGYNVHKLEYGYLSNSRLADSITGANIKVDAEGTLFDPEIHAQNKNYLQRFQKLNAEIDEILCKSELAPGEQRDLFIKIGQALHLLQDFFSHTDWIDGKRLVPYYKKEWRQGAGGMLPLIEGGEQHAPHDKPPTIDELLNGSRDLESVLYFDGGYKPWVVHRSTISWQSMRKGLAEISGQNLRPSKMQDDRLWRQQNPT